MTETAWGQTQNQASAVKTEMFPDLNSVLEPTATQKAEMYVSKMDRKTQSTQFMIELT